MVKVQDVLMGFEYFMHSNSLTVHKKQYVFDDDLLVSETPLMSLAFQCNQLEDLKKYLGEGYNSLIDYIKTLWTPEAIEAYMKRLAEIS